MRAVLASVGSDTSKASAGGWIGALVQIWIGGGGERGRFSPASEAMPMRGRSAEGGAAPTAGGGCGLALDVRRKKKSS